MISNPAVCAVSDFCVPVSKLRTETKQNLLQLLCCCHPGLMQWSQTVFVLLEPLNLAYLVGKTPWYAKEDEKRGSWTLWEKGIHCIVNEHMMCRRNHWTLTIITSSTCARGMWLCDEFSCVCMLTISGCKTLSFSAFLGDRKSVV